MEIKLATLEELDGIFALLRANHVSGLSEEEQADGFVTTALTDAQMTRLIAQEHGVTVAQERGRVLAFAMAAPWSFWAEWPLFAYMIEKLPAFKLAGQTLTTQNSYQYGPICVDRRVRGSGLFEQVFACSLDSMRARYPLMATFINQRNPRSYAAHTRKVHMTQAGTFQYDDKDYYLMACSTSLVRPATLGVPGETV